MTKKKVKALVLFSGGLDSRLVVKLLQEQGIEIICLHFLLPFGCGCCNNSSCNFKFCQINDSKLILVDCTKGKGFKDYLKLLENPKYGFGNGMNPCINCRIFMLKHAKRIMKNLGADFIATGEVVGQRPMSQYKTALENIEKETNLVNQIVRPLSARALPKTLAEKNKLINVKEFLDIIGRTRSRQIELAKKFKIEYPMPAGGCLLCDKNYSIKLKDLIEHKKLNKKQKNKQLTEAEIYSLDGFRHFRDNGRIILGRNHEQNLQLEKLNKSLKYNILFAEDKGPTAIYENKKDKSLVRELIIAFSTGNLKEREKFNTYRIIQD